MDENGKLLPGYKKILREVYEEHLFEKKKPVFKSLAFLDEAKGLFTELMNSQLSEREQCVSSLKTVHIFPQRRSARTIRKSKRYKKITK